MSSIDINPQFEEALETIEKSNSHLLITGKAGTGKSTLLSYIRLHTKKKFAVIAPTGIAAVNVDGETIHSFFKFKPVVSPREAQKQGKSVRNKGLYKALGLLIIDEISMVRADLMDAMDLFLKSVRGNEDPFGGVQMLFIGDLFQLPPVVTRDEFSDFIDIYETPYFFSSIIFRQIAYDLNFIELEKVYRQNEEEFIEILNAIRTATVTEEQLSFLNERCCNKQLTTRSIIYLASTNYIADDLNRRYLANLPGATKKHKAKLNGVFEGRTLPTDEELQLKIGARVMFLNNDSNKRWINGTLGTITDLPENSITKSVKVRIDDGNEVEVDEFEWTAYKSAFDQKENTIKREEVGSFKQIPLRLAWAITIHKSQGKTFDNLMIDLGKGAFAYGQTYVALSRCRTIDGIYLKKPISPKDIMVDENIVEFYRRMRR